MDDLTEILALLKRLGSAAIGAILSATSVWLAYQNMSRPGWADASIIFWVPITVLLMTVAAFAWWFFLRGDRPASRATMRASWKGGLWVGGAGLALGVAVPAVIWPDANLGPLLGFLVTGPLGFPAGALAVLGLSIRKKNREVWTAQ